MRGKLCNTSLGNGFMDMTLKAQAKKAKIDNRLHQTKHFCIIKETNEMKSQHMEEDICKPYILKRESPKYVRNSYNSTLKKQNKN